MSMKQYDLLFEGKKIGVTEVKVNGLYYFFRCRYSGGCSRILRFYVECAGKITDLGICVPYETYFGTQCYIPIRKVGTGELRFYAAEGKQEEFFPVHSDEPFRQLHRIIDSKYAILDGTVGVVCKKADF